MREGLVCKGCYELGTACGKCSRCTAELLKRNSNGEERKEYAIVTNTEDGPSIDFVSKATLLERITPTRGGDCYYGEKRFGKQLTDISMETLPEDVMLILKVELVIPKEKKVAVTYDV